MARGGEAGPVLLGQTVVQLKGVCPGKSSNPFSPSPRPSRAPAPGGRTRSCRLLTKNVLKHPMWFMLMTFCLVIALFGGDLCTLANVADEPGLDILDTLMVIVFAVFLAEMMLCWIVDSRYLVSVWFVMDLLGTASMVFEISWLLGNLEMIGDSAVARAARATKIGARAWRISKAIKYLSLFKQPADTERVSAEGISNRLMTSLSMKVALLTMLLTLIMPFFQGSHTDPSTSFWSRRLEADYNRSVVAVQGGPATEAWRFQSSVLEMRSFYADESFYPFKLEGFPNEVSLNPIVSVHVPTAALELHGDISHVREQNALKQAVPTCLVPREGCGHGDLASLSFDMTARNQSQAVLDMLFILFVILVMMLATFDLSRTLGRLVVVPLEKMLLTVRSVASSLCQEVSTLETGAESEGLRGTGEQEDELALLMRVLQKLTRITKATSQRNPLGSDSELLDISAEGRGVIQEILQYDLAPVHRSSMTSNGRRSTPACIMVDATSKYKSEQVNSWDFDFLSMSEDDLVHLVMHVFFNTELGQEGGAACQLKQNTFTAFHDQVRKGYLKNPYHNYEHAVDTLHSVYRVMSLTGITAWQGEVDHFALLLSALGHDLGHAGFTNPFLVETKHELALRYNDQSPLENMHCARLFEIASSAGCNVFEGLEPVTYKQARKTCVSMILHTDIAKHFDMVKSIAIIYELHSEICDAQAAKQYEVLPLYLDEVLMKHAGEWTNMILHFCDVSNCMKPFPLCQKWAIRVLEEFFNQGDEEARRGLPVGLLNNRDTVSRPGSQHGFINFLVAPLALGAAKVFAPLLPLSEQMVSNMDAWKKIWIQDSQPSEEDIGKKTADVDKIRDTCKALKDRE